MQPAQEEVARVLAALPLADPRIPVAANVTGGLVTAAEAPATRLSTRSPARCAGSNACSRSIARARNCFIEVGPGKVLCGLLKQIDPARKSLNVEDAASLEKTLAELASAKISDG